MTRDPVYASELAHDTAGVDASPFLGEALESIVDDLMWHGRVNGLRWGLQDFLHEQDDLHELVSASICTRDQKALSDEIERRLKRELSDHDAVHDLAAQLAAEPDEQA